MYIKHMQPQLFQTYRGFNHAIATSSWSVPLSPPSTCLPSGARVCLRDPRRSTTINVSADLCMILSQSCTNVATNFRLGRLMENPPGKPYEL